MKTYSVTFIIFIVFSVFSASHAQEGKCFRIGMNAGGLTDVFINQFLSFRMWEPKQNEISCDPDGYPLQVPCRKNDGTEAEKIVYLIANQPTMKLKEDTTYILRWDGDGDIAIGSWFNRQYLIIEQGTNLIKFKPSYREEDQRHRHITVNMTRSNPNNHIRNMRLYKESFENLFETQGEIFNPYYIDHVKSFYMIRFMGSFGTNNSPFTAWEDHTPRNYWNQTSGPAGCGLSYELAAELCNKTGNHLWFNVPHAADNYSIRKMAEIVYKTLRPDLQVYLEYSNETWNAGDFYQQWKYVEEYSKARNLSRDQAHVELSKNIFTIWRDVFGDDYLRVRRTIATQTPHIALGARRLEALDADDFDVYSPSFYFHYFGDWNRNTSVDQMVADVKNYIANEWYTKRIKPNTDLAKTYDKEIYCYEGGFGGNPGDTINEYPYWRNFQKLQSDPRFRNILNEVIDTVESAGWKGGNELSLFGNWEFHPVTKNISFWGCMPDMYANPVNYPKYQGYLDRMEDCDNIIRESDTIGPGLAFRFDGIDDYIDFPDTYKPDDNTGNYTIECWIKPEKLNKEQCIVSMARNTGPGANTIILTQGNRIQWSIGDNNGGRIANLTGPAIALHQWYHITAVKQGTSYKLYVNGTEKASARGNSAGDCSRNRLLLGAKLHTGATSAFFDGKIDEFRIWNTGISDISVARNWMCKKVSAMHPQYAHLQGYYCMDKVHTNGTVEDHKNGRHGLLRNVHFSLYSNYLPSGAPIGDDSKQLYPPSWDNVSISYAHPAGDKFTVSDIQSGAPEGVHVYMIDHKPTKAILPSENYTKMGSRYYGVFVVNGTNSTYHARYNYNGNPDATDEIKNRLLKRTSGESERWSHSGAQLNTETHMLITRPGTEKLRGEYILGLRDAQQKDVTDPGYALEFGGGVGTGAVLDPYLRPDKEYTVSMWIKPSRERANGAIIRFEAGHGSNHTSVILGWHYSLGIQTGPNHQQISTDAGYVLDATGWNHLAIVKKMEKITVYLNGIPAITDFTLGRLSNGKPRDAGFMRMILGDGGDAFRPGYKGYMDELQVWDIALSESQIREWMCKGISSEHPLEASHLVTCFKFNEGSGGFLENTRGPGELELKGNIRWVHSGAPIGTASRYTYSANNVTLSHPDGDFMRIDMDAANSTYKGIHVYRTDNAPSLLQYPNSIQSIDTTRYWGVFIVPVANQGKIGYYTYDARYNYQGNKNVVEENNIRLLSRHDASIASWTYHDISPNTSTHSIQVPFQTADTCFTNNYCSKPVELLLGGVTPTALSIDTSRPPQPGPIEGKGAVCSGETGVRYSIGPVANADYYIWQLPNGLSGYSQGDSIVVSVDAGISGNIGAIQVRSVNRYGASDWSNKAITVEATPSLTVTIDGKTEVCANESGVVYTIPTISNASSYQWTSTNDAVINGNGTSATVRFGSENTIVSAHGVFGCGTSLLNTKPVTVQQIPSADIPVSGNRVCKGISDFTRITISGSETGITYQAYKNGDIPVGDPVVGTGSDIGLVLPINELLPGDNIITIKANTGDCSTVTLSGKPSVIIDIPVDRNLRVYAENNPLCKGYPAHVVIENSPSAVEYTAYADYSWTIASNPPVVIRPSVVGTGGDTRLSIRPAPWNMQMSGMGIGLGPNKVFLQAKSGFCPTVFLEDTVHIMVPHSPRSVYWKDFDYWDVPIPPEDTVDIRIISHPYTDHAFSMCSNETVELEVLNAERGVQYTAYALVEGEDDKAVSQTVTCNVERGAVRLTIPPNSLPAGMDQKVLGVKANNGTCDVLLARRPVVDVYGAPDSVLAVSDYTVCRTGNAQITVTGSQSGIQYRARLLGSSYQTAPQNGNGNNLTFSIPNSRLSLGVNKIVIDANAERCSDVTLLDTSNVYSVTDLNATLRTKGNYTTLCIGVDGEITIYDPEPGVQYTPYYNTIQMGDPVTGEGDSIIVIIAEDKLRNYAPGNVTIAIKATAGSCETNLTNTIAFSLSDKAYPEGGIRAFDAVNRMCPGNEHVTITELNYDAGGEWWPMYIQGRVENKLIGSPVLVDTVHQHNREPNISIQFPRNELPLGDTAEMGFVAKMDGCPPKKLDFDCWHCNFTSAKQPTYIVPDYVEKQIVPDTVCIGEIAKVKIIDPEGSGEGGFNYRLYDPVNDIQITIPEGTSWWNVDDNGDITLSIFDDSYLKPGRNEFDVQVQSGECGWASIRTKAVIYVNEAPLDTLTVTGNSICDGDASIDIANTQLNVYYQAFIGNTGVSDHIKGNGGTITIPVAQRWLSAGTNEMSVKASIPGCVNSVLQQRARIDVTDHPPAKPGSIQGETGFCGNATGIEYSVPFDQTASSYTWNLPPGASTDAASNIALVDFGTTGGNITVTANNVCGSSAPSDPLSVTVTPIAQGGTVIGPDTTVCSGSEVTLELSGHTGAVTKWQWSEQSDVWNDIMRTDSSLHHTVGNTPVTFRAAIGDGSCGQAYSSTHTVRTKSCTHVTLGSPVPIPRGGSYTQQDLVVTFDRSGQDSVRDIYYVVCGNSTNCSMDSAKLYDPMQGIVLDIVHNGHKGIRFQARPKPGKESRYRPGSIDSALYIYSKSVLGVPVPNPVGGIYDTSFVRIVFEKIDQSSVREIYWTACDDTNGCGLTLSNRQLYDTSTGILLDISQGKKGIVFQAVPLDPIRYEPSPVGKALYLYKPGIGVEYAAYFDTDADGRIDRAKTTFKKDMPKLPESITLDAPYDKSESVVMTPLQLSRRSVVLDFPDKEFSRQVTGFVTGEYGKVNDTEGFFNTNPFDIADSVAPVIVSATYAMKGEPDDNSYLDTLVVTFSEEITQSGTVPFVYTGTNANITLTEITIQGNRLRAIVPIPASDKSNTLQPGDSIAIRTGTVGNTIGDTKGNIQNNPDNIRVPIRLLPPKDFFRMRSGPTLFDPSQRHFIVNLAPNERISVLDHESGGSITIYDGVGNMVLSEHLDRIQNTLEYIWTGHNRNGRLVGQGTYVVVIEFTMSGMSATTKMKIGVKR